MVTSGHSLLVQMCKSAADISKGCSIPKPPPQAYFTQLGNVKTYMLCNQTSMHVNYNFHEACGSALLGINRYEVFQNHLALFGEHVNMSK